MKTLLTVYCINGHEVELDIMSFGPCWVFQCPVCGTEYCQRSIKKIEEFER